MERKYHTKSGIWVISGQIDRWRSNGDSKINISTRVEICEGRNTRAWIKNQNSKRPGIIDSL